MYAYVLTGRAGDKAWPAKTFTDASEMPVKIFADVFTGIAAACAENVKQLRASELYEKMNFLERSLCENVLIAPVRALDPNYDQAPNYATPVVYTFQRVALHD